ncbi:MAG: phosphotransferase [Streptosporangiaceae bacterium]|nr:phosphotransferase [Streptosporangiaceae bacterium]
MGRQDQLRRLVSHHEFIDGESLDEFVSGRRHLRDREAVDVALNLLNALVAFHPDAPRLQQLDAKRREGGLPEAESREWTQLKDKGLVHRDIKPRNVMITRTGAKLLDFNIASWVGDPVHTQSGTPPYQPPDAGLDHWDVSTDPVRRRGPALPAPVQRPAPVPGCDSHGRRTGERPQNDPL